MSKYRDGEYLDLHWEYGDPDGLYVKGHVSLSDFRAAIEKYYGEDASLYTIEEVSHIFGRWSLEASYDGAGTVLRTYDDPGRGRFKLTKAPYRYTPPTPMTCTKCNGEGLIADTDDQEPWSCWANLPPGSDMAVRMGIVKPISCPVCKEAAR